MKYLSLLTLFGLLSIGGCSGNVNDSGIFQTNTVLVSISNTEVQGNDNSILGSKTETESPSNVISADGRYIVFSSKATTFDPNVSAERSHIYIRDMEARTTTIVDISASGGETDDDTDPGNTNGVDNFNPSISADGRFVAFVSNGVNLIPGGTSAGRTHVYRRDLFLGVTDLVSLEAVTGDEGGRIRMILHAIPPSPPMEDMSPLNRT